jgi:AraC-like DNA-binding protein
MRSSPSPVPAVWQATPPSISASQRQKLVKKRDQWLGQIAPDYLFHRLFNAIPGVYFFAKNREGEVMFVSRSMCDLYRLNDEAAFIGLTDFDLNPPDMAQAYVADDEAIYAGNQDIFQRVELWFDAQGIPAWCLVNKMPIKSRTGEPIGIMGVLQSYEDRARSLPPLHGLSKAITHVREKFSEEIEIGTLARLAGISQRQLQRKFRGLFGVSPHEFILKTRLLAACQRLRETDQSLAEISSTCGFPDQSAFSRHFRAHIGLTPRQYRVSARSGARQ